MDRVYVNTNVVDENVILEINVPLEWDDEERNIGARIKKDYIVNKPNTEIYDFFHSNNNCFNNYSSDEESYSEYTTDEEEYNSYTDNYKVVYEYWKDDKYVKLPDTDYTMKNNYTAYTMECGECGEFVMNEDLLETNAMYL